LIFKIKTSILYNILVKDGVMPQLSLYIDEITLRKIEKAAKIDHVSLSKFVVKKLNDVMISDWPDSYDLLYGAINDDSFNIESTLSYNDDHPRESL
jgi:hypothetical protein|nr:hypothetical protein [Spirochaetaceae bacterium]